MVAVTATDVGGACQIALLLPLNQCQPPSSSTNSIAAIANWFTSGLAISVAQNGRFFFGMAGIS